MHLVEQSAIDMRDPAEALPRQRETSRLDRARELERALVIQGEEVV